MCYPICHAEGGDKLHLRDPGNAYETYCGRQVTQGTMILMASWESPDEKWCDGCYRR